MSPSESDRPHPDRPDPPRQVPTLLSGREAAALLAPHGVARSRARRVLESGLAGPTLRTSSAVLVDAGRVRELATWPLLTATDVDRICPHGLLVLRLAHRRALDVTRPWSDQADSLARGWPMSIWSAVRVGLALDHVPGPGSALPVVATVCGFVAFGADLRRVMARGPETDLALEPPGPWFRRFERHRFPTAPGKEWLLWRRSWEEDIRRGHGRPLGPLSPPP